MERGQFVRLLCGLTLLGCVFTLTSTPALAQRMKTAVVSLGFNTAQELIPVIKPLVPSPGVVTGRQNQLIIKTTPANLAEVKAVLKSLDRAPANLLISVRHQLDDEIRRDLAGTAAEVHAGGVRLKVGGQSSGAGLHAHAEGSRSQASAHLRSSHRTSRQRDKQRIRVLEGRQAFIQTGLSVPYEQGTTVIGSSGVTTVRTTQFRDVSTGIYVRPQLSGDRVRLEVSQHRNRLGNANHPHRIQVSESSSAVSTVLGRWTELAANVSSNTSGVSGLAAKQTVQRDRTLRVYVKVERMH